MTFVIEKSPVSTLRALKSVIAKIDGVAEQEAFAVIQNRITQLAILVHISDPVNMIPDDVFDSWLIWIEIQMVRIKGAVEGIIRIKLFI